MATKIISDITGKELPEKESMTVTVHFEPYDDERYEPSSYTYDAGIHDQLSLTSALDGLFPYSPNSVTSAKRIRPRKAA